MGGTVVQRARTSLFWTLLSKKKNINFQGQSDASALSRAILLMVLSLWDWPIWSPLLSYCGATPAFSVLASSALPAYLETEFMVGGLSLDTAQVLCSLIAALDAK